MVAVLAAAISPALGPVLVVPFDPPSTVAAWAAGPVQPEVWPIPEWQTATPEEMGMNAAQLVQAREYALKGGGSGYIIRSGKLVFSWGSPKVRYDLKSTTKSIGATGLGLALQDGLLDLDHFGHRYHPDLGKSPKQNEKTGWLDKITLRHLATHTAGFEKDKASPDILFAPGSAWAYSDGGANWLAEVLTLSYGEDLHAVFFSRLFTPLGIPPKELSWRKNQARPKIRRIMNREFGSGISASVNALARIGYLYLREGRWRGEQLIPESFVTDARHPQPSVVGLPEMFPAEYGNASDHYGLLWWNNWAGTLKNVPRDAYWSWGLGDSLIIVIPSLDIVVARAGDGWRPDWNPDYQVLRPFIEPIVDSVL
jgi:CubicO group peptidase (beta-lactamase class C family)